MSVLGCAPASLHPTYDYSIQDSQADCRAPFLLLCLSGNSCCGGSQRRSGRHRETQSNTQKARRLPADVKGRLPRPLPVLLSFVQLRQRGLATTKRTSSRNAKQYPKGTAPPCKYAWRLLHFVTNDDAHIPRKGRSFRMRQPGRRCPGCCSRGLLPTSAAPIQGPSGC